MTIQIKYVNNEIKKVMKVLVCFSLVMLSLLLFVRCKSSEEVVKFKPYKFKDYVTKEIEVYEARECSIRYWIYNNETKECPMYQGLKIKIGFYLWGLE